MADEMNMDAGIDSGSTGSQGVEHSGQQTTDVDLQSKMASGDDLWYDDGLGWYKGSNPIQNKDGSFVRKDEIDAWKAANNQTQTAKTQVQRPAAPQANQNMFEQFDPQKSTAFFQSILKSNAGYKSQTAAPQPQQEIPAQQGQQPAQPNPEQKQVDIVTEVQQYKDNMMEHALAPYQEAAQALQDAGLWTNENPKAIALHDKMVQVEKNINELASRKQMELIEKFIKEGKDSDTKKASDAEMNMAIQKSRFNVVNSLNLGSDSNLDFLLTGKEVTKNGKTAFEPGPGADLVFDMVQFVSEITGEKNLDSIYNKMISNEKRLRTLVGYCASMWTAQNIGKNNETVRRQTQTEERNRQKLGSLPSRSINPVGQANGLPKELGFYSTV